MMNTGPIYIVDDDIDDEDLIRDAFAQLGYSNELKFFITAEGLLNELKNNSTTPFIIISDINLPKMDGFQLRDKILQESTFTNRTIPFIFWSTTASEAQIKRAYDLSAHGFFLKGRTFSELKDELDEMIRYWSKSLSPSK